MIDWRRIPDTMDAEPFTGGEVLLAVPNNDPEYPWTIHRGRWGEDDVLFHTDSCDEDGDCVWLEPKDISWWAALTMPEEDEYIVIPRMV